MLKLIKLVIGALSAGLATGVGAELIRNPAYTVKILEKIIGGTETPQMQAYTYDKKSNKKIVDIDDIIRDDVILKNKTALRISPKIKLSYVFALFKMIRLEQTIIECEPFIQFVNRKLVKHAILTYFYGSGILTRCENYHEHFITQCINAKMPITRLEIQHLRRFGTYIDHLLCKWVQEVLPEARILYKIFYYLGKDENFIPPVISDSHVTWVYEPHVTVPRSKSIYNKDYKLELYTDELDHKKIASGYLANYFQSKDSIVCSKIIKILHAQNIPVLTVHDCFKVPHHFAEQLKAAMISAYKEFHAENHLATDFGPGTLFWQVYQLIIQSNTFDMTPLDINQLNISTMAKPS